MTVPSVVQAIAVKKDKVDPTDLVLHVRQALTRVGYLLVDDADERTPGLRVSEVVSGARITWTASDGFVALADRDHDPGSLHEGVPMANVQVLVQAAVQNLLMELGYIVVRALDDGDLIVLASPPPGSEPAGG
jgi:hypothetical protein